MRKSLVITVLAVCSLCIITSCGKNNGKNGDEAAEEKNLVPIEVSTVTTGDIAAFFNGTATLEAEEDAQVVAKVSGVVKEILVEEGDYVKAGDILAKLDGEILSVELAQAEATMNRLQEDYNRKQTLFDRDAISVDIYQQAKYEYESQKAARDLVKLNLDYTSIKAPIDGIITERHVKIGNMVLTNATVFRITDFDPLTSVLYVPEREIGKLNVGQSANVIVDALSDEIFTGAVDRISPIVDPQTGTVKVTVEVADPDKKLKIGMFCRVSIIHDTHSNTFLVPRDAIVKEDDQSMVFVVQDSITLKQPVQTGYVNTTHIEILEGLAVADTVVITGQGSLEDSTYIEIISN